MLSATSHTKGYTNNLYMWHSKDKLGQSRTGIKTVQVTIDIKSQSPENELTAMNRESLFLSKTEVWGPWNTDHETTQYPDLS